MKTLLAMRHAKSDWNADYGGDHERPLNERGIRSARVMGEVLAERELVPDLVISSTAVRARTTAELAAESGRWQGSLILDRRLYDSGPDGVVARASEAPDVGSLMLVGHQPTWSILVADLTGQDVEMKTATVAVISVEIDAWSELTPGIGLLADVLQPRDFLS